MPPNPRQPGSVARSPGDFAQACATLVLNFATTAARCGVVFHWRSVVSSRVRRDKRAAMNAVRSVELGDHREAHLLDGCGVVGREPQQSIEILVAPLESRGRAARLLVRLGQQLERALVVAEMLLGIGQSPM